MLYFERFAIFDISEQTLIQRSAGDQQPSKQQRGAITLSCLHSAME